MEKVEVEKVDHIERPTAEIKEEYTQIEGIDAGLNRRITRRFDRHLIPWLFGIWLLAFIDRSNMYGKRAVEYYIASIH